MSSGRSAVWRRRGTSRCRPTASAAACAERDDALFARAQRLVRMHLLARGAALGIGDDIFWISDDTSWGAGDAAATIEDLRRRASAARNAAQRAALWQMTLIVGGDGGNVTTYSSSSS